MNYEIFVREWNAATKMDKVLAFLNSAGLKPVRVPMWELEIINEGTTQSRANFTDAEHMVRDYLNSVYEDRRGESATLSYRYFGRCDD